MYLNDRMWSSMNSFLNHKLDLIHITAPPCPELLTHTSPPLTNYYLENEEVVPRGDHIVKWALALLCE